MEDMKVDPLTGLSLPANVLEGKLERELWLQSEEGKVLQRVQKAMADRDINIMLQCAKCHQFIMFTNEGHEASAVCACKRRILG